jgi:hypothetical protein
LDEVEEEAGNSGEENGECSRWHGEIPKAKLQIPNNLQKPLQQVIHSLYGDLCENRVEKVTPELDFKP